MIERIPISTIQIPKGHRNPKRVETLAESIKHVGQINPIVVRDDMQLIAGGRRLAAVKLLGFDNILANILTVDDIDAELLEIDENLERHELTVIQRADQLKRRKELYEARYPETKAGVAGGKARQGKGKSATQMISFADEVAAKTGVSPETVRQEVQIAEDLDEDVKEAIRGTDLEDRKVDLLELARLPKEEQGAVVEEVTKAKGRGKKTTVAKAAKTLGVKAKRGKKSAPVTSDDDWLAGMPLASKLEGVPLKIFQEDALAYRASQKALQAFYVATSEIVTNAKRKGAFVARLKAMIGTKAPDKWKACGGDIGCGGSGKSKAKRAAFAEGSGTWSSEEHQEKSGILWISLLTHY